VTTEQTTANSAARIVRLDDAALLIARAVPDGGLREQSLVPFAPAVPVTEEVSMLDQIVALLGRRPGWPD
jgi:hypothetical protein